MKNIQAERVVHRGEKRVTLKFPFDRELISLVKTIPGSKWSASMTCWHIPDSGDVAGLLLKVFRDKAFIDYSALINTERNKVTGGSEKETSGESKSGRLSLKKGEFPEPGEKIREDVESFRRWLEAHRYPSSTVRTYCTMLDTFLRFASPKESHECTADDVVRFVDEYIIPSGLSYSYQNQLISALKKFYGKICHRTIDTGQLERPRRQRKLPNVLSKDEVKKVLDCVRNEKHRLMLSMIYGCGLRRSEVLNLDLSDIDRSRKLLRIRQSKGYKDRFVPLSDKLAEMVERYLLHHNTEKYLFEGQIAGTRYSEASIEKIFRSAFEKSGINKTGITLHGLRHSYATHLLEAGTDLRYIQELLGHKSSRTTEIYTHVTVQSIQKIRSPFDDL